jgi:DNA-binding LacI/PurR family transcriptional regulator
MATAGAPLQLPATKTTLEDLARLADVSISTVSRALNDHPSISVRTKQRIWALARDHDYPFRASMATSPVGADGAIVIVTPFLRGDPLPLSHPFFLELLANIGEAARARLCDFTVSHIAAAGFDDLVHATTASRASGVIFLGQAALHEEFNRLAETNANFVVWGARLPNQSYRSVSTDNLAGGRRATLHLARLGRTRIAFVGGHDPEALLRRRGHLEALASAGLRADPDLMLQVDFELESADAAIANLLHRGIAFDGVVAASDLMALGAMRALRRASVAVPEAVSVVGYDDILISRLSTPALTTVRQDTREAGRILVSSLLDAPHGAFQKILPADLIVRESCGA